MQESNFLTNYSYTVKNNSKYSKLNMCVFVQGAIVCPLSQIKQINLINVNTFFRNKHGFIGRVRITTVTIQIILI